MYSDAFCKVYNEFGWNYYLEIFGEQLLEWLRAHAVTVRASLDLACGTGVLCEILHQSGIEASGMDFSEGMIEIAAKNNLQIHYEVADMITYCPEKRFDLVTCTGDALNHIPSLQNVQRIFENVFVYLNPGGYFIFDILNEREISTSEPFDLEFSETITAQFQMLRPREEEVHLHIRVYENGRLQFEETIRETLHASAEICRLLRDCGFRILQCGDRLLEDAQNHGTTCFVVAEKPKD